MTAAEKTKHQFAHALRKLLKKKNFNEIRVTDLCRELDCQRATFYYHFEDKYDLAAWIYMDSQEKIFGDRHAEFNMENCIEAAKALKADAAFYKKTLSDDALTGLYKYIIAYYSKLFSRVVMKRCNKTELEEDMMLSIHYAACAGMFMTREWLFDEISMSAEQMVRCTIENMPERLKHVLFPGQ